ncbi:MAG: hypothetical protein K9G30_06065 [Parvibaculum sp.]|nr:hypothetical protein [Parvibaculum sp.]
MSDQFQAIPTAHTRGTSRLAGRLTGVKIGPASIDRRHPLELEKTIMPGADLCSLFEN